MTMITDPSYWEKVYKGPLENISWNRAQADYFKHAVDEGKITGKSALDIGCGMGFKSVYLAEKGFEKVIGVDLSPTAIEYCRTLAAEKGTVDRTNFVVGNILDELPQLNDSKFDFVLDWAALHCIDRSYHQRYLDQLLAHSHAGSLYLLRTFSSDDEQKDHFIDHKAGSTSKVCVMQKSEIEALLAPHFEILEHKTSKPHRQDNLKFIEFLMRRRP